MQKLGLLARLEAKPGKEQEVLELLTGAQSLVAEETGTITWFAFKIGPSTFGIFDTFYDADGRNAHLAGKVVSVLMSKVPDLFAGDPLVEFTEILALK